jgi:hypothetical protein
VSDKEMGLYELVKGIREDFKKIVNDPGIKEAPLFIVKNVELELGITVSKAAETGIKFFIVTGSGEYKKEQIHRIKLEFQPITQVEPKKMELKLDESQPMLFGPFTIKQFRELLKKEE